MFKNAPTLKNEELLIIILIIITDALTVLLKVGALKEIPGTIVLLILVIPSVTFVASLNMLPGNRNPKRNRIQKIVLIISIFTTITLFII